MNDLGPRGRGGGIGGLAVDHIGARAPGGRASYEISWQEEHTRRIREETSDASSLPRRSRGGGRRNMRIYDNHKCD